MDGTPQDVWLITGAASGMGKLATTRALDAGTKVIALDVSPDGLAALGDAPGLFTRQVDVTDAQAVRDAVAAGEAALGPITRVVHAAAIMPLGAALEQPADVVTRVMRINYDGLVHVAHAALPGMVARGTGAFVSFASLAGHMPLENMSAYNASKFAVVAYTEVLREELRDSGVHMVCVCPPMVATPLLDQARETIWPRSFNLLPPIAPDAVLDAIDRAVAKRRFWVFPGPITRLVWWLRRWSPSLVWVFNRWLERRGPTRPVFRQRGGRTVE